MRDCTPARSLSPTTIPLNSELLKVLAEHKTWYEKNVRKPSGEHFVFPTGANNRFATKPVTSFENGLEPSSSRSQSLFKVHDLMHSLITKLAETDAGDETIVGIAGHVSRRMLSRYAHIRTDANRKALEAIVQIAWPFRS